MKCTKCGNEMRPWINANGQQMASCDTCKYDMQVGTFSQQQGKLKNSGMSIAAFILSFLGCLSIVGLILGIIDLVKKDATKKHGLSIAAIVISVIWIFIGIYNVGNTDTTSTDNTNSDTSIESTISDDTSDQETSDTSSETESEVDTTQDEVSDLTTDSETTSYNVGDTWESKYMNVTYTECGEYTEYESYAAPSDGNKIVYAKFEFENVGNSDETAMYTDFNCYADGYSADAYYFADDSGFAETLSSGRKCTGSVYFEVPVDATSIEFEYSVNFWTSENIVFNFSE